MIDRIEELLGQMAAEDGEDEREDALALPGAAAAPAAPRDRGAAEEIQRRKKAWSTRVMSAFSGACSACLALCPPRSGRKK